MFRLLSKRNQVRFSDSSIQFSSKLAVATSPASSQSACTWRMLSVSAALPCFATPAMAREGHVARQHVAVRTDASAGSYVDGAACVRAPAVGAFAPQPWDNGPPCEPITASEDLSRLHPAAPNGARYPDLLEEAIDSCEREAERSLVDKSTVTLLL